MKRPIVTILLAVTLAPVRSQVLCVQCYEQNDSIGINVGSNDLITNGGFENTTCATGCAGVYCPSAMSFNCSIANWTCTGGGTLTYACVYDSAQHMVAKGARAAYFGNSYANPCSGTLGSPFPNNDTTCLVHSGCEIIGVPASGYPLSGTNYGGANGISLAQTVNGLTPGMIYVLEFWAGGEYQGWFSNEGMFAVDVGFGKTFLKCKVTQQLPDLGTRYLIQFAATSPTHTIKFTNWGHICGSCTEVVIDDVRLYEQGYLPQNIPLCSTTIPDAAGHDIRVFHDRSNGSLNMTTGNDFPSDVVILDMLSRVVVVRGFTSAISIPLDALPSGCYAYALRSSAVVITGTFVKE